MKFLPSHLRLLLVAHCALLIAPPLRAQAPDFPVYVSSMPNLNDYRVFANGGWDGNWYVGFDTCWIKKLPPPPPGNYNRAFIGVKLGRMKLLPAKNPRDKLPVPGSIFAAISSTPAWTKAQSFLVAQTQDIPAEGDFELPLEGVGESQWFWTEVPLQSINFSGANFVAVWSPTPERMNISSSPVLAAGLGANDSDTWLARDMHGEPPRQVIDPPGGIISYFQPAIALKLIPAGVSHPVTVRLISWSQGTAQHPKPVVAADVQGDSIERVWFEYHVGKRGNSWAKAGRPVWTAPYMITLEQSQLPRGKVQLRVAAANIWEETGVSTTFQVQVSTISVKK